jgi:hypothetical protein
MLRDVLTRLQPDGEVSGCVQSDLTQAERETGICGFCANEPSQLVGLVLINKQDQGERTRLLTVSVCLALCSDCYTELTSSFKMTVI